jgi:hypothetical protein
MKAEVAPSLTESPESEYLVWDAPNIDFKELVAMMLGGLDISLVDPAIFPQIVPHIQRYIEYYQESHKQRNVKQLNDLLRYIENGPRGGQIKSLLKAPSTPPRRQTAASS